MALRDAVGAQVSALLGGHDIPDALIEAYLDESATLDSLGRVPGAPDWDPTYDVFWVAGRVAENNALTPQTKRLSVDGDSIEVTTVDWGSIATKMFSRSLAERGIPVPAGDSELVVDLTTESHSPTSGGGK